MDPRFDQLRHTVDLRRAIERGADCIDQRVDIVGRDEVLGLGAEDLRDAADARGYARHAGGRRLEHHIGQRFGA